MQVRITFDPDPHREGEVVDVDDVVGARLIREGRARTADARPPAEVPLDGMTRDELAARAGELGLVTTGTKAELRDRILAVSSTAVPAPPTTDE